MMMKNETAKHVSRRIQEQMAGVQGILQDVIWGCNGAQFWTTQENHDQLVAVSVYLAEAKRQLALADDALLKLYKPTKDKK